MSLNERYNDKWTFTNPKTDSQVDKKYWTKIEYFSCIKYKATPYDTDYDDYFIARYSRSSYDYLYG